MYGLLYGLLNQGEAYLIPTWLVREQRLAQLQINQSINACNLQADRRVIVATAMIVVGCIVLVAFGNHQSKPLNSHQLQHLFQK